MPDVAGVLRDEQEVSLSSQGPGGMGLGDGAGQGLVVRVDDQAPPLDVVLELLDRSGYSQELPVKSGVSGLGVGESMAEEGEWLEPPSMVLMEDTADGGVGGIGGDGQGDV